MPIYTCYCRECNYEEDYIATIEGRHAALNGRFCPHCGTQLRKHGASLGGFVLKGRGWADDGYGTLWGDSETARIKNKMRREGRGPYKEEVSDTCGAVVGKKIEDPYKLEAFSQKFPSKPLPEED